jgi:hypothetical protein
MHDVEPRLFATVIREMIRHENDVTNHRIMWLLIVQGLIANAYVGAGRDNVNAVMMMASVGILVTLSAFVMLYKSYQARGYLQFLGSEAKRGTLLEESLPLAGWPPNRVMGWRRNIWICPWLGRVGDLLEPYFFLPSLLLLCWLIVLMRHWLTLDVGMLMVLCILLAAVILSVFCISWVWWEDKDEQPLQQPQR